METIYILTNPLFPDYVKLGYTKCLYSRLKKMSTSVPMAYNVIFQVKSKYASKIEKKIHTGLSTDLRINSKNTGGSEWYKIGEREFFMDIDQFINHVKTETERYTKWFRR